MKYKASRKADLEKNTGYRNPNPETDGKSLGVESTEVKGRHGIRRKMNLEEAPFIKKA